MSVTIKYKGNTIASANTDTTKTLKTSGKYCEADIEVVNTQDGGITPSGSITLTEERSYDVTDKATAVVDFSTTRANLAEAVTAKGVDTLPTSSFDTIATNIGLIEGGGESDWDLPNGAEIATFSLTSLMTSNFTIDNPFGAVKNNLFIIKKSLPVPGITQKGVLFCYAVNGQYSNNDNAYNRIGAATLPVESIGDSTSSSVLNSGYNGKYIAIASQTPSNITFKADSSYRQFTAGNYLIIGWD